MKYISYVYMVKIKLDKKSVDLSLDENPIDKFQELGINFSCSSGICGICKIKVKKGMKNINHKTEEEGVFPLGENERLACQCQKIKGDIEIDNPDF